jgi:alpha-1,6-mannosyltransferase
MLQIIAKKQFLYTFALVTASILCGVLAVGGVTSFFEAIVGEETNFNSESFNGVSSIRILSTFSYISLCACYLLWLFRSQSISNELKFKQIIKPAIPFLLLALIAYPLSNDIYLYLQYGLMNLRGVNPFIISASHVSSVLMPLLYWLQTSTYGPISQLFFTGSAVFIRVNPILGVYVFKLFCLFIYIFNAYLIWRLLKNSLSRSKLTIAYLLNPFLLIAHVADAHVDVFLCCSVIILIGCLHHRLYVAAILAIAAGFLTKTLPIIWLPMVIGFLISRRLWKTLAIAAGAIAVLILILSQTIFPTVAAWKSLLNPGVSGLTARSIHHLINLGLSFFTGSTFIENQPTIQQLSRMTIFGFAIFYCWKLLQPYLQRKYSEVNLVNDLGWVTIALLLGATPWLMSWYPSVLLPFAVLIRNVPIFSIASLTFCLTSGALIGAGSGNTPLSLVGCLLTLAPVFAVLIWRRQVLEKFHGLAQESNFIISEPVASMDIVRSPQAQQF